MGRSRSLESNRKQSRTMSSLYAKGIIKWSWKTHQYSYRLVKMRSDWEVKFATWCDLHKISWLYEKKRFVLKKNRTYTPDFYLPSLDLYVEVKGFLTSYSLKKLQEFGRLYPDITLVLATGNVLKAIGAMRVA